MPAKQLKPENVLLAEITILRTVEGDSGWAGVMAME
jgi:hypothetical protein